MRPLLVVAALCTLALLAACDGDSDADASPNPTTEATPTAEVSATAGVSATPIATPEATPTSPPGPRRTGDPKLDAIIGAVEDGDVDALLAFLRTMVVECRGTADSSPIGSPPSCADLGVPPGTEVTVAGAAHCVGYLSPDPRALVEQFMSQQSGLYAVVSSSRHDNLLFHGSASRGGVAPILRVEDGRIFSVNAGCMRTAAERLDDELIGGYEITAGPWHDPAAFGPRRTGDPALDAIIEAVEARDVDALVSLLRTEVVECRGPDDPSQIGSPPSCEDEGVPVGTDLTVAYRRGCEGNPYTDFRAGLETWLGQQDGLYGVSDSDGRRDLVFHGVLAGLNAGKALWIEDGQIAFIGFGCATPAELMAPPDTLTHGPWPDPLTPRVDAVRALVGPFLEAVEARNAAPLVEATEHNFLGHGCTTSRDASAVLNAFVDADPQLVGIYEPTPRGWLDQWWLVFRLSSGDHVRLLVDVRPRIEAVFHPCDATLERVTTGSGGDPVPLLRAP